MSDTLPPLPKPERLFENDDALICGYTQDQMHAYALAARQQAQVPEGFVLVPVEPTEDMLFAAELSKPRGYRDLWAAMLAAAPRPEAGSGLRDDWSAPAAPAPEAQPADKWGAFGYLRKTNSKDHPPHGWSFHFCGKPGDVPVWTTPLKAEAQAAGQDERAAFEAWFKSFRHGWKSEKDVAFDTWQTRAALAQRQPLTWDQIESIRAQVLTRALQLRDGCDDKTWDHWFARAIEHAHGIGATTGGQQR